MAHALVLDETSKSLSTTEELHADRKRTKRSDRATLFFIMLSKIAAFLIFGLTITLTAILFSMFLKASGFASFALLAQSFTMLFSGTAVAFLPGAIGAIGEVSKRLKAG